MTDDELRDDFGDDLVDALSVRSRAPTDDAGVGVAVRGRVRRIRARRAFAAVVAAAVAVIGAGAIVRSQDDTKHIRVANPSSSTTTGPFSLIPLTSGVQDWTWVNDEHGWALVRRPCGKTVCVGLRETVDGGRTWTSLPAPDALDAELFADANFGPVAACAARPCLSSVRFATPEVGWLYGPALFQTLDGGQTWTRLTAERVSDVEAAHGIAMRVTSHDTGCAAGCSYSIDRLDLDTTRWERLAHAPVSVNPGLLLQGADAYAVNFPHWAGGGETHLAVSRNAGATWTAIDDPCPGNRTGYRTVSVSAAPNGVLAVLCVSVTGDEAVVQISTDRGKTFGPRRAVPGSTFGPIAAASADTIAIGYSVPQRSGLIVTHDGGRTWRSALVASPAASRTGTLTPSVGWQDANTGRASFNTKFIWTTRDGGRSWIRDRVTP
jgi:photosystem II stability/assembly factor-like uncharacterized protein